MSPDHSNIESLVGEILDSLRLALAEMVDGDPARATDHLAAATVLQTELARQPDDVPEFEYAAAEKLCQGCSDLIDAVHAFVRETLDGDMPDRRPA